MADEVNRAIKDFDRPPKLSVTILQRWMSVMVSHDCVGSGLRLIRSQLSVSKSDRHVTARTTVVAPGERPAAIPASF